MKIKTAYMGLMLAFALILSYVEILIPLPTGIPGIKLGLANLAVVLCLYLFGWKKALFLTMAKAIVSGFLFGSLFMTIYNIAGAAVSFAVMAFMHKSKAFHVPVVSAVGGVMHNMGQAIVAYFAVTYGIVYYIPILIFSGLCTGAVIGMVTVLVLPYINRVIREDRV